MTSIPSPVLTFHGLGSTGTIIEWDMQNYIAVFTNDMINVTTVMHTSNGNLTLKVKDVAFRNPFIKLADDASNLKHSVKAKLTQVA